MEKEIPGWKARSCSLGKKNKLQLRKMKRLKFEEDRPFDEEDAVIVRGLRVFVST
jgi:hypothetical protein